MNKFRLLNADEIECRIAQIKEKGISLLLYKTARTDANLLDETVGEENWENDFKLVDGVLYGGIGIHYDGTFENGRHEPRVIWKWDAGTESNTEAEKGRASDAFKRAGFKWGIGRELYTAPFIWIPSGKANIVNGKCYDKFEVTEIGYNDKREINHLVIINSSSRVEVFRMDEKVDKTLSKEAAEKITMKEAKVLEAVIKEKEAKIDKLLDYYKVAKLVDLTAEQYADALGKLNGN